MKRMRWMTVLLLAVAIGAEHLEAAEHFVNKQGNDANDGLSRTNAFLTVQKGVSALQPGDTLTIGPGEYCEAVVREDLGSSEKDTIIRAEIPQTVVLRGDVPAPSFRKVEEYRFVYAADFSHEATALNEVDSLAILESAPNLLELEFTPGKFYQDANAGKIYISSSDLQPPGRHSYTVCVLKGRGGLCLMRPQRVIIEGLAATGFNTRSRLAMLPGGDGASDSVPWGIFLQNAKRCAVRNCAAYLNSGGIAVQSGLTNGYNVIEKCVSYGNWSTHSGEGGNILVFKTNHDVIRNCYAYVGGENGIRIYLPTRCGDDPAGLMEYCLGWGHQRFDFHVKAEPLAMARNCVALRAGGVTNQKLYDSLVIGGPGGSKTNEENNILSLSDQTTLDMDKEFADAENLDFRLQPASRFRGAGPGGKDRGPFPYRENIFYVSPAGDDKADGLSLGSAWKTLARGAGKLRPGDTLYLARGVYPGDLNINTGDKDGEPIYIRGRGTSPVLITGKLAVTGARGMVFQRLNFAGEVMVRGCRDIRFENCSFTAGGTALQATDVDNLRAAHCEFTGFRDAAVAIRGGSGAFLSGNLYDNAGAPALQVDRPEAILYSDYNAYRNGEGAWRIAVDLRSLTQLQGPRDKYSTVRKPEYKVEEGVARLQNPDDFSSVGPLGTACGIYIEQRRYRDNLLGVEGPFVHSVSGTTADIEWWSARRAIFEARWGETPECTNSVRLTPAKAYHLGSPLQPFNSFSLAGLKPSTKYYFRIGSAVEHDDPGRALVMPDSALRQITFTTVASADQRREYYVAPEGNDGNSGLDRRNAWKTIHHAAGRAGPGDTVLIAGGVYKESVQVRVTGDKDRPITFRSVPGEQVWLDGAGHTLVYAFNIANKNNIALDGLYFREYQRWKEQGMIRLARCRDIRITRCFQDGRQGGYAPEFLTAGGVDGLLVKNCVSINAWDGMAWGGGVAADRKATNVRIENNIIVHPLICALASSGGEGIKILNNIITDNLLAKRKTSLIAGGPMGGSSSLANNCFFLRFPESERPVFGHQGSLTMGEKWWNKEGLGGHSNLLANPQFAVMRETSTNAHASLYFTDSLVVKARDFPDLFATNPELVERGIGLQPEAFKDFHFNSNRK